MFKKISFKKKLLVMFVISSAVLMAFTIITLNSKTEAIAPEQEQTVAVTAAPQTNDVIVKVQNYVSPEGKKCYQYTVENNASRPVVGVDVGLEQSTFSTELNTLPDGWVPEYDEGGAVETASSTSLGSVDITI